MNLSMSLHLSKKERDFGMVEKSRHEILEAFNFRFMHHISQPEWREAKGEATKVQSLLSRKPLMFTGTAKVTNLRSLLKMTG